LVILCLVLIPYSLTPVHIGNPEGNTDYVWSSGSWWCKMTEGISLGKFDEIGFNNKEVIDNPDIVVLGSSHTEATNVMQSDNFAALLGQKFEGVYTYYYMGISGHFFLKICKYLPKTMELMPDTKYIIIETSNVSFDQNDVNSLLNGTVEFTASKSAGIIGALQKLPFLRVVYSQLTGGLLDMLISSKTQSPAVLTTLASETLPEEAVYDTLFAYIRDVLRNADTQLIILYHPTGTLLQDGTVSFVNSEKSLALFGEKCQEYGFYFVNMTHPFEEMYKSEHKLPHGFVTGQIGVGHLNKDGHAKIADELAGCIAAIEGGR